MWNKVHVYELKTEYVQVWYLKKKHIVVFHLNSISRHCKKKGGLFCKFPMGKQNETNQTGPVYIHKVKHKQTSADVDLSELLDFQHLNNVNQFKHQSTWSPKGKNRECPFSHNWENRKKKV